MNPWIRENIRQFQRSLPQAKILILPEGHHYCFIRKEEEVYNAMREFLLP